jgi:hypothetical protein
MRPWERLPLTLPGKVSGPFEIFPPPLARQKVFANCRMVVLLIRISTNRKGRSKTSFSSNVRVAARAELAICPLNFHQTRQPPISAFSKILLTRIGGSVKAAYLQNA